MSSEFNTVLALGDSFGMVGQFMSWPVPALSVDSTIPQARGALAQWGADHAVVVSGGDVCGLLCGRDLTELDDRDAVMWAMTSRISLIHPTTALVEAAGALGDSPICAVIVDAVDGSYGILTRDDLVGTAFEPAMLCALCGRAHRVRVTGVGDFGLCDECLDDLVDRDLDDLCHDLEGQ